MSNLPDAPFKAPKEKQWLPREFVPSEDHVLVGRGKVCYRHSGNRQLSDIVQSFMAEYSLAEATKKSKSQLIKKIVAMVREKEADFVKYDVDNAAWYKVDERTAREKVSQTFRDVSGDSYRSSVAAKTMKRRQERFDKLATKKPKKVPKKTLISFSVTSKRKEREDPRKDLTLGAVTAESVRTRPTRPDPPAAVSASLVQHKEAEIGSAQGTTIVDHLAAQNLQRLAEISTALSPAYDLPMVSPRRQMGVAATDFSYAGYLKDVISRREYTSRHLSLLGAQKASNMRGTYANFHSPFGRTNIPGFYR